MFQGRENQKEMKSIFYGDWIEGGLNPLSFFIIKNKLQAASDEKGQM